MKGLGKSFLAVVFIFSLFFVVGNAGADIVKNTINLEVPNSALYTYDPWYAKVEISFDSNTPNLATFTVQSNTEKGYLVGDGSTIALNTNGAVSLVSSYNPGSGFGFYSDGFWWNGGKNSGSGQLTAFSVVGSQNVSEFGTFNFIVDNNDGMGCAVSSLSFQLQKSSGSWANVFDVLTNNYPTNPSMGNTVAAHIFMPLQNVTGYAGDKAVGTPYVPVPPTVWLLGAGLVGLWGVRRRFLKK